MEPVSRLRGPPPGWKTREGGTADATERTQAAPGEAGASAEANRETLRFDVDVEKGSVVIEVVDEETGEVLRTIPPDEVKRALEALRATGRAAVDKVA